MAYSVFLDESGDLGWTFNKPYRKEGSSRYFTLAYVILPNREIKHITRLVNRFFKAEGITKEYKGTDFSKGRSKNMAKRITNLIDAHPYVKIGAITAKKTNAPKPIIDNNEGVILYNHMMQRTICPHLIGMDNVTLIPDERSVPRGSKIAALI